MSCVQLREPYKNPDAMADICNASTLTVKWDKETREVAGRSRASYLGVSHARAERRETPQHGRREWTPESCPPTATLAMYMHGLPHTHVHIQTYTE